MGVTIHFDGKLKNKTDFEAIMKSAEEFAEKNQMEYSFFEEVDKLLLRVKDEAEWDYQGVTRGIRIQPDENSDPFNLEFDNENYIQEYCKTQFAIFEIHIKLIEFLNSIKSHFDQLNVFDEGEYWNTHNAEILKKNIKNCFDQIEIAKQNDKTLDGPFRIADGRIADLMHTSQQQF
jgi:Asp-tRNA(Asn)/Glu-tRNA(Gln) amidotransferase C subunit